MPSKLRDSDRDPRPRDSPRKESSRSEKREHHKSSHRKRSPTRDHDKNFDRSSTSTYDRRSSLPSTLPSDDASSLPTMNSSKTSLPYPTFSKAHSKEAVAPKDAARGDIPTPDATDISASREKLERLNLKTTPQPRTAPPSPPLTHNEHETPTKSAPKPAHVESVLSEKGRPSGLGERVKVKIRHKVSRSTGNLRAESDVDSPRSSSELSSKQSPSSPVKTRLREEASAPRRSASQPQSINHPPRTASPLTASSVADQTRTSSNATSVAPHQPNTQRPASIPPGAQWNPGSRSVEPVDVFVIPENDTLSGVNLSQAPPPPPPPPIVPVSIPRVDYLLRNGGLPQSVPKNMLLAGQPIEVQQAYADGAQFNPALATLFTPYNKLLNDYESVISKNGSLAVATGYRSVARRLLDRLEAVFARDISSEYCTCCMCGIQQHGPDERGVSWGEILEMVSGRRDLPTWPPFNFVPSSAGLGLSFEEHVPMQKLDIDIPEEYRDHYVRQSKKTKSSVDKWLARQTTGLTSPPSDVDDETLTFAILTHVGPQARPAYASLLGISMAAFNAPDRMPTPQRGPTPLGQQSPAPRDRPESLLIAGQAVKRLYRLNENPRNPEIALFMLNNPSLHNALATLAAVSNDEWEILVSGRFDGFLRSGADAEPAMPQSNQGTRAPSRNGPSRGPTPSQNFSHQGAPISYDEEMEIATLAEVERDIFQGMEALEDAFEALHARAEDIRRALRERGAGLSLAAQRRRGMNEDGVEIRMGTPAMGDRWEAETDDGLGDWDRASEIAPDDSASNISSSRRRRPKRRTERRTPAPVSEEEEESDGTASPRKR